MKITILLLAVILSGIMSANAQKKTEYKASNGIIYHVGDTIQLGRGSRDDGSFNYLQVNNTFSAFVGGEPNQGVAKSFSGTNVIIKKIREMNMRGASKVYFVVGGGSITNYWLMIDDALATGEVIDPTKKNMENNKQNTTGSKADKLRELKELFDEGILTQEEFDKEKKKILEN